MDKRVFDYSIEQADVGEKGEAFRSRMIEKAIAEDKGIVCYLVGAKEIPADGEIKGKGKLSCRLRQIVQANPA